MLFCTAIRTFRGTEKSRLRDATKSRRARERRLAGDCRWEN
jgi:hypothetical protein